MFFLSIQKAIDNYDKSLLYNPNKWESHYNKGNAFCQNGDSNNALECYQKAFEKNCNNSKIDFNLGNILFMLNKIKISLKYLELEIAFENNNIQWHNFIGKIDVSEEKIENEIQYFN